MFPEEATHLVSSVVDKLHFRDDTVDKVSDRNARWFAEVARVKEGLQSIETLMKPAPGKKLTEDMGLADLFKEYKRVHEKWFNEVEEAKINDLIENRIDAVHGNVTRCKNLLEEMKEEIAEFQVSVGENYQGCEVKMRQTMHGSLCRRLHSLAREFQALQVQRKEMQKKSILQQVQLVLRGENQEKLQEDELEEKVDHFMQTGESPFAAHMEGGALWMKAKNTLDDVKEKHRDIQRLEAGISELADMFNDLALLVSAQGEIIDRIEVNVSNTNSYTANAVENLAKSNAYGRSNRRKMCIIIWLLACVCCFILGPTIPLVMVMSDS